MWKSFLDVVDIVRISGLSGFRRLVGHSRRLKSHGAPFAMMHCLIALERTGIHNALLSNGGVDLRAHPELDCDTLRAVCEYLYERDVLTKSGTDTFCARDPRAFEHLTEAMHACAAYHDPVERLDRLITGEYRYGQHVSRSDKYDALASATLTSIFSYEFAHRVLARSGARSVLDCGCGTGEFLDHLRRRGFDDALLGMDLAKDAIQDGRELGFETGRVKLFVGDLLDLQASLETADVSDVDVFSFMFVLHEFSSEQIASVLGCIRTVCPRARILLTELERRSSEETRRAGRTMLPELKFVHLISKQILRSSDEWVELFGAAGLRPVIQQSNRLTSQICFLFAPP